VKRVPWFKIQRALIDAIRRVERQLSTQTGREQIEHLKRRVAEEYEVFCNAVTVWTHLREQRLVDAKRVMLRALGALHSAIETPGTGTRIEDSVPA